MVTVPEELLQALPEEQRALVDSNYQQKRLGIVSSKLAIKTKQLEGHTVCAALEGVPGEQALCSIHEHKPRGCSRYVPGSSKACAQTRAGAI